MNDNDVESGLGSMGIVIIGLAVVFLITLSGLILW
jgi:hypothetical protein